MSVKKMLNSLTLLLAVLISALGLMGCSTSSEEQSRQDLAIVYGGNLSNQVAADPKSFSDVVSDCIMSHGNAYVIVPSGNPKVTQSQSFEDEAIQKASSAARKKISAKRSREFLETLVTASDTEAQVDLLSAFQLAGRLLSDSDAPRKTLIINASGLSTSGYLAFQNGLLYCNPQEIVAAAEKDNQLPNLVNVEVIFFNLGSVSGTQQVLSNSERENLKAIYQSILTKAGASSVSFKEASSGDCKEPEGQPVVDPIAIRPVESLQLTASEATQAISDHGLELDEARLQFKPDSAEFLNYEMATASLDPVAEALKSSGREVLVVGTTAGEDCQAARDLSSQRASAVFDYLVSKGVSPATMRAVGIGGMNHLLRADETQGLNHLNRKVLILAADRVQELLGITL